MKASLLNRFTLLLLCLCLVLGAAFLVLLPQLLPQMLALPALQPPRTGLCLGPGRWMLGSARAVILYTLIPMMRSLRGPLIPATCAACGTWASPWHGGADRRRRGAVLQPMLLFVAMAELLCALFSMVLCASSKRPWIPGRERADNMRPHDTRELDVMMAKRRMGLAELAERMDITQANLSILKNNKGKAVAFHAQRRLPALACHRGTCWNTLTGGRRMSEQQFYQRKP